MNSMVIAHRFFENVEKFKDKPALLSKITAQYRPLTYQELGEKVRSISLVLDSWGMQKGDRAAILSENREEWMMSDLANLSIGVVSVPVYPTLSAESSLALFRHAAPRVLFVSNMEQLTKALSTGYLFEHVILFDGTATDERVTLLSEVINQGNRLHTEKPEHFVELMEKVEPGDLVCINYTSGTTGEPKGVMLTNLNFVRDVDNSVQIICIYPEDTFLSFLPLSHVLERMGGYYVPMLLGATVGFAESVEKVVDNMSEVQPTILISVPRLFEKIYGTVMSGVNAGSFLKKKIFFWALKSARPRMFAELHGLVPTWWQKQKISIADRLVFNKLQKRTGGRLQRFVSGGAPLSKEIAEFFFCAGLRIYEGYGLTETSPVITVNGPGKVRIGAVGVAVPETEFKIAADNEILVRGPQVMKGYYKNEAATREVIDPDGFLHTGDIGYFDGDGFLFLTDRKKNILITAGGKNVAPQPIEDAIKLSPYIAEVVVVGDRRPFISALVVADQNALIKWAESNRLVFENYATLIEMPQVKSLMEAEIERQTSHFSRFEKIKKFSILPHDFTIETGELTPSLKVKKKVVLEKYAALIEKMYQD